MKADYINVDVLVLNIRWSFLAIKIVLYLDTYLNVLYLDTLNLIMSSYVRVSLSA